MAIASKKVKRSAREKSKISIRKKISGNAERPRVSVFKSSKHTYAQLIVDEANKTVVSAATTEEAVQKKISQLAKEVKEGKPVASLKSMLAAKAVGMVLAERAKAQNIARVVFDRNGFVFIGRVKAVADGARAGGLDF